MAEHSDIGRMISESLEAGKPEAPKSDKPVDSEIKPLSIAEYRSTRAAADQAEKDYEEEQEARLELDRAMNAKQDVNPEPASFEPSGLELADDRRTAKGTSAEDMGDVMSMKRANAKPMMQPKKKRGLLSWLRGE